MAKTVAVAGQYKLLERLMKMLPANTPIEAIGEGAQIAASDVEGDSSPQAEIIRELAEPAIGKSTNKGRERRG